jgi:hypothetical protein
MASMAATGEVASNVSKIEYAEPALLRLRDRIARSEGLVLSMIACPTPDALLSGSASSDKVC